MISKVLWLLLVLALWAAYVWLGEQEIARLRQECRDGTLMALALVGLSVPNFLLGLLIGLRGWLPWPRRWGGRG